MAVSACEAVLLDLLAQVHKFCEEQGEADFETGAANAMKRRIVGLQAEPHLTRQLDKVLTAYGVPAEPDMRAICEALGFDPTNHHNAAKCPYCRSSTPGVILRDGSQQE